MKNKCDRKLIGVTNWKPTKLMMTVTGNSNKQQSWSIWKGREGWKNVEQTGWHHVAVVYGGGRASMS